MSQGVRLKMMAMSSEWEKLRETITYAIGASSRYPQNNGSEPDNDDSGGWDYRDAHGRDPDENDD